MTDQLQFPPHSYFAYPESNAFADAGRSLVYAVIRPEDEHCALFKRNIGPGARSCDVQLTDYLPGGAGEGVLWYDIARRSNILSLTSSHSVYTLDLNLPDAQLEEVYSVPEGQLIQGIPNITADGSTIITSARVPSPEDAAAFEEAFRTGKSVPYERRIHQKPSRTEGISIDVATRVSRSFIAVDYWADHFHPCPHDAQWILFGRQGLVDHTGGIMWAYHPQFAPQGRSIWDQMTGDNTQPLVLGHACFSRTDLSIVIACYGHSPAGPRGLWEVFLDNRAPRLISESNCDWHPNVSPDGRYAVVDTLGAHELDGSNSQGTDGISDIVLVDMHTGRRKFQARSHLGTHPYHLHPHFTPDGRTILFNDLAPDGFDSPPRVRAVEVDIDGI